MKRVLALLMAVAMLGMPLALATENWAQTVAGMDEKELLSLYDTLQTEMISRGIPISNSSNSADMVWISISGKKYHAKSTCGMDAPMEIALEQAKFGGYEPCKRCKAPQ